MSGWEFAIMLKPFGLLLMFIPGAVIAYLLRKHLRYGLLKRILFFSWRV